MSDSVECIGTWTNGDSLLKSLSDDILPPKIVMSLKSFGLSGGSDVFGSFRCSPPPIGATPPSYPADCGGAGALEKSHFNAAIPQRSASVALLVDVADLLAVADRGMVARKSSSDCREDPCLRVGLRSYCVRNRIAAANPSKNVTTDTILKKLHGRSPTTSPVRALTRMWNTLP